MTTESAIELCKTYEPILRDNGWHVGLTGSCLYGMGTGKDVDFIIYPHVHDDGSTSPLTPSQVLELINVADSYCTHDEDYPDSVKYIWIGTASNGDRHDFFFLK